MKASDKTTDWWRVSLGSGRVLHVSSGCLTKARSVDDLIEAVRSLAPMLPEWFAPEVDAEWAE